MLAIGGEGGTMASYQLVGFFLWAISAVIMGIFSDDIAGNAVAGVIELIFLSPTGLLRYIVCKAISRVLLQIIPFSILLILVLYTTGVKLMLDPVPTLIILTLTMTGFCGLGLIFGGLVLRFKRIGPISLLVRGALLFVTGVMIPVDKFPLQMQTISQLFPMTQGLIMMRKVTVNGISLWELIQNGDMLILIVNSLAYLIVGVVVFKFMENVTRNKGVMGVY
jgi:ABC-2 type transport system permease protein